MYGAGAFISRDDWGEAYTRLVGSKVGCAVIDETHEIERGREGGREEPAPVREKEERRGREVGREG